MTTERLDNFTSTATPSITDEANNAPRWSAEWLDQHVVQTAKTSALESVSILNLQPGGATAEAAVPASFGTPEWVAETGTKFAVGILPYLVMGRFTGAGARAFAEANSLERTAFGKFAASEMQTQVAGAAIYDAAKNPREGETRAGNVVGNALTFGLLGSKLGGETTLVSMLARPLIAGAAGSTASQLIAQPLDKFDIEKVGVTAATSMFIPGLQHGFKLGANALDSAIGRGIPTPRYIDMKGWSDLSEVSASDARLTRVLTGDGPARIEDGKTLIVPKGADDQEIRGILAHDGAHKINELNLQTNLDKAALLIEKDPEAARASFINARREDEVFARAQEAKLLGKPAPPEAGAKPGPLDATHEAQYAKEAQAFIDSKGTERPKVSFGAGGDVGGHGGGEHGGATMGGADGAVGGVRRFSRLLNIFGSKRADISEREVTDAVSTKFDKPSIQTIPGTDQRFLTTQIEEKMVPGSNPPEYSYKKITDMDGTVAIYDRAGIDTEFGKADFVQKDRHGHSRFHIIEPPRENVEDIQPNSMYDSYIGGTASRYGVVHSIETQTDGTKVFRSKNSEAKDNFITWELPEGSGWNYNFGREAGEWSTATKWADGAKETWMYTAKDGSSLFQLPKGEYASVTLDDKPLEGIRSTFRSSTGRTVYADEANNHVEVTPGPGKALDLKYFVDEVEKPNYTNSAGEVMPKTASRVKESYTTNLVIERSPTNTKSTDRVTSAYVEVLPGSTKALTPGSMFETHTPPKLLPQGVVYRTEYPFLPGSTTEFSEPVDYLGNRFYQRYSSANIMDSKSPVRETPLGQAYGHFMESDGNFTYHLRGQDIAKGDPGIGWPQHTKTVYAKTFDQPVELSLDKGMPNLDKLLKGTVNDVERSLVSGDQVYAPDGSMYEEGVTAKAVYKTNAGEKIEVPLGNGGQIFIRRPDGSVIPNTNLGDKIVEQYATPQETPFGRANALTLRTEGSATYSIMDNPNYYEVRQFIIPRSIGQGIQPINYAQHMNDGNWILMANDGKKFKLTEDQFRSAFGNN